MEKKYQIFISSTYEDLKDERKKVQDTILSMYQFPIGMEMFSAADEEQWEIIQETIDSSDYYVLIIGHRYGSVIKEGEYAGISYTQKEFRYALENNVPILAFIIDDNASITLGMVESDETKRFKLQEFKNEVKSERLVQWWTNGDDLAAKVMNAINKQINRGKRPGWIRADKFDVDDIQNELVEMSKKIRKLERENEELRSQVAVRKPDLILEINGGSELLEVPYCEYNTNEIDCEYVELSMEDVPSGYQSIITQTKLDEYNATLPSKEVIDTFKDEWRIFRQTQENPFYIELKVCNEGTMKANDIYLEIQFPKEILIYSKNEEVAEPLWPTKGKNPIEECIRKDRFCQANAPVINPKYPSLSDYLGTDSVLQMNSPNKCFYNEDNSFSIRMEDLMIEYTWNTGKNYYLVPTQRGTYDIVCSIVCEEYEKNISQIIKLVVK